MRPLFVCILIFCALNSFSQQRFQLTGNVFKEDSITGLPGTYVYNKQLLEVKATDNKGFFSITARAGDTIIFSAGGYQTIAYAVNDIIKNLTNGNAKIVLMKLIQLQSVRVTTSRKIVSDKEFYGKILNKPATQSLQSPISLIYDQFSKKAQDLEKFRELYAKMEMQKAARRKLNAYLNTLGKPMDDTQLEEFLRNCRLNDYFIVHGREYDVVMAVKKCLAEKN